MKKYKVVFIDIDNTLLDFNACAKQAMMESAEEMNISLPDNVLETFLPINNSLWARIEQGTLTIDQLHEIRWNTVFSAIGITGDGPKFEQLFKKNLFYTAVKVDGAKELLEYLSQKYIVCAASNGPYEQQEYRLNKAGLLPYVSKVFVSERAQVSKPSALFFDYCFAQLNDIKPQECIMIGDSLTADIGGAKSYGMSTCWFDYYNTDKTTPLADHKITHLLDLKNIL